MDGRTDGWTDGRMDGWMDRWMNGSMDGWINEWIGYSSDKSSELRDEPMSVHAVLSIIIFSQSQGSRYCRQYFISQHCHSYYKIWI